MSDYYRKQSPVSVSWQRTSGPSYQLITVAEARQHLRLETYGTDDDTAEDNYLTELAASRPSAATKS